MDLKKLKKDFLWYSIGAAIPMILGFIKTPIFTRYYTPADYGYFTLINTTFSYINLFAFSWLLSCVWRYYIREKNRKELNKFYTNIIALLFIGLIVTIMISFVWVILTNDMLIRKLIIANCINLVATALTTIYLIIIRLDGKALIYNLYIIVNSVVSFAILFILTFLFKNSIDAMINCSNIINVFFLIYIIYKFKKNYRLNKDDISKDLIKKFVTYGFTTVFINASLLLLTSGDRYVIKFFCSADKVGIYSQIYGIAQISILAFSNIIKNIITPYEFKLFEEDINNENEFYRYIIIYIICILPLTIYFSMYSKQIANLLLGEKFRGGYKMMPYIMISCLLYGLSDMHQDRIKFKNKLKIVALSVIISGVLNIILDIMFIPIYGYEVAAVTTLVSYIVLYLLNIYFDISDKYNFFNILKDKFKLLLPIVAILILQVLFHKIITIKYNYCSTIIYSIIEGVIFLIIYLDYVYYKFKKL